MDATMKIGPAGSTIYMAHVTEWDHKGRSKVFQIFVLIGANFFHFLRFQYVENGRLVTSEIIGSQPFGVGATNFETWTLDYPSEYITTVSGRYSSPSKNYDSYIEELTIMTNKRGSGKTFRVDSCPSEDSRLFKFSLGDLNQFGGFHGTYNCNGLVTIGVYISPVMALPDGAMKCKHCEPPTRQVEDDTQQSQLSITTGLTIHDA